MGLGEMRAGPSDDPVGREVLDDWSADFADDEDPFVWERGVGEGDVAGVLGLSPVDWGSFAESEGRSEVEVARLQLAAAQWVSPLLFAPVFVGAKPPERMAFDLVVDQVAVTLHRASRDGLSELEAGAAAQARAEELAARVREAGLEGAPDVRRTARPPVRGVGGVSSSVGGVGQRGLMGAGRRGGGRGRCIRVSRRLGRRRSSLPPTRPRAGMVRSRPGSRILIQGRKKLGGVGSLWRSWVGGLCGLKPREKPQRLRQDGNGCMPRIAELELRLGGRRGVLRPGRRSGFSGVGYLGRSWVGGLCGLKTREEPRRLRKE